MTPVSRKLIKEFESAIIREFHRIGADPSRFSTDDLAAGFKCGGMPSEWRSNLYEALRILYAFDQSSAEPWGHKAPGYYLRETLLSAINAMRRDDYATFKRILRHAADTWGRKRDEL